MINALLTWFPRLLALAFALFLANFALDAWQENATFFGRLGGFLIHLLPTVAVIGALGLAWRRRVIGGLVFMVLGLVFTVLFGTWRTGALFAMISLPLLLAGLLFILSRLDVKKS